MRPPRPAADLLKPMHPVSSRGFPDPTTWGGPASAVTRRHRGGGLPGVCGLTRRPALEPRPAWRRATARSAFACLFRVCAVFSHQACTDGSVFFRHRLSKAGLSESTQHIRLVLDPSIRSRLHCSVLGCFSSIYAKCKVPLSRQASDRRGLCRCLTAGGAKRPSRSNAGRRDRPGMPTLAIYPRFHQVHRQRRHPTGVLA